MLAACCEFLGRSPLGRQPQQQHPDLPRQQAQQQSARGRPQQEAARGRPQQEAAGQGAHQAAGGEGRGPPGQCIDLYGAGGSGAARAAAGCTAAGADVGGGSRLGGYGAGGSDSVDGSGCGGRVGGGGDSVGVDGSGGGCSEPGAGASEGRCSGNRSGGFRSTGGGGSGACMLLFNLFALEGVHIAEALDVACAALSPYTIPYSCPSGFARRFQRAHPRLFAALQAARCGGDTSSRGGGGSGGERLVVSWSEVEHWMWPLFTERWGPWRQEALGRHPVPFLDLPPLVTHVQERLDMSSEPGGVLPGGAQIGNNVDRLSPTRAGQARAWSEGSASAHAHLSAAATTAALATALGGGAGAAGGAAVLQWRALPPHGLPRAVPLLYGFSELVVPRPQFWPPSVHVCGFWLHLEKQPQKLLLAAAAAATSAAAAASATVAAAAGADQEEHQHRCAVRGAGRPMVDASGQLGCNPDSEGVGGMQRREPRTPGSRGSQLPAALLQWLAGRATDDGHSPDDPAASSPPAACASPPEAGASSGGGGGRGAPGAAAMAASAAVDDVASPVLVDFGSMGRMGFIPDAHALLQVVVRALELLPRRGLLLSGGWPPLAAAHAALPPSARRQLRLHASPLPHAALLPRCAAVLHPGGSGTLAAALAAGLPQLLCPLHFDQHAWAQRLEYLELTPPPLRADELLLDGCSEETAAAGRAQRAGASLAGAGRAGVVGLGAIRCAPGPPPVPCGGGARVTSGVLERTQAAAALLVTRLSAALEPRVRARCRAKAAELAAERGLEVAAACIRTELVGALGLNGGGCWGHVVMPAVVPFHRPRSDLI